MKPVTIALLALFLLGCGASEQLSEYPLANGDSFEYRAIDNPMKQYGIEGSIVFRVQEKDAEGFTIRRVSKVKGQGGEQLTELPDQDTMYDAFGRIVGTANPKGPGKNKGRFSSLWLPPEKRQPGATVKIQNFFKQEATVGEPTTWQGRNVWVVTILNYKYYYDRDAGFLVGWTDSVRPMKLIASNRDLL